MAKNSYKMTISRLTVDKLGVKLYDRASAVIAELLANSYDADATTVEVQAPMDVLLATKVGGAVKDGGYEIVIVDDGCGMTPEEMNAFYLVVGAERRNDKRRGDTSSKYRRKVMGRKGVGKLAPFGICSHLEVISSGGAKVTGKDPEGNSKKGYLTSHIILKREDIISATDKDYVPVVGDKDGTVSPKHGTTIRMTKFDHRRVPSMESLERQLAQRFGIPSPNWKIDLVDTTKTTGSTERTKSVGTLEIETTLGTMLKFEDGEVIDPTGKKLVDIKGSFPFEGRDYVVNGWVAYSATPYKDDLMSGIRIYCRNKIAAQTLIFNLKAGFTGEYDIRSYLVGQITADWLDEGEDLIRTDRQDILWSSELGQAFEEWGQGIVKYVGSIARTPRKVKAWDKFREKSKIEERLKKAFPSDRQEAIRSNSLDIAKAIAQTTREDELNTPAQIKTIVDLSMLLGPHITLSNTLKKAAEANDDPLSVMNSILGTARIAELSAFGRIADNRVQIIKKVESLKNKKNTLEAAFQNLIDQAPWLINPQWSPITSNQSFATLKKAFKEFYKSKTKRDLLLDSFSDETKRADFVLSNMSQTIEIIEIKRPKHKLSDEEYKRLYRYYALMEEFLSKPGNSEFKTEFPKFHITLVCDGIGLSPVVNEAFTGLVNRDYLTHITWDVFLMRTRKMHEAFLNEAERQRQDAALSD